MNKIVFDAEDAVVGRLGSHAAKELLKGKEVIIINSEKAIITGDKKNIIERILRLRKKGGSSQKGPKISKLPDKLLKRMIRGMLPWDKPRGKEVYKNLKCHSGNSIKIDAEIKKIQIGKKPSKYLTIKQISELI
ncbi:MAG: 50S ribosomal protein L13 [Nanoarchaeota archaeon]